MSDSKKDFFDQPTRVIGSSSQTKTGQTKPGRPADPLDQPTRTAGHGAQAPAQAPASAGNEKAAAGASPDATQVYRPGRAAPVEAASSASASAEAAQASEGPVVGWLVVIDGPGKGKSLGLGYGWNNIGRGDDQAVILNFGDGEISRNNHCSIAYDPKNRRFFIQHGGGRNLTYIGNDPVLAPTGLEANADIVIGRTTLRFVPFCGAAFDWQDLIGESVEAQ